MNIKISVITILSALLMGMQAHAAVSLCVNNPTNRQRNEVVAFDAKRVWNVLGVKESTSLIVKDLYRLEIPSQLTHDNQLLIEATVMPMATARYTVEAGTPRTYKSAVDGYYAKWRVDDYTWENDKAIFRVYGPELQRRGEKAFGIDAWLKSTEELEVRSRYNSFRKGCEEADALRKEGNKAAADSVTLHTTWHLDHGTGLDCYNVGPSLGCGTPAIMLGDSIVMPWCYKEYKVLDNGPLRFTLQLLYPTTTINGAKVTEHRIISVDKGCYFNKMTVWYDGLNGVADVAGGVVMHDEQPNNLVIHRNYIAYSDPTDNPEKHNFQIYVGVVFPNGADKTTLVKDLYHQKQGIVGNAVGVRRCVKSNEKVTYWFGASWCKSGTPDQDTWISQINKFIDNCNTPLNLSIQHKQ